jgi:hypothetical protein
LADRLGAYVVTNFYLNSQQYYLNGIKSVVPVTEMNMVRCGVGTSKYYLDDFEASNRQFIQKNRTVLYCDRLPVSNVARLFLLSEVFG